MRVVVVGAGLLGVSTAYFLAKDGHKVTVLDRATEVARETSFANGGIITPSMSDPWNAPGVWKQLIKYLGKEDSPLLLRPKALPSLVFWGLNFLRNSSVKRFYTNTGYNARLCSYSADLMTEVEPDLPSGYDKGPGGTLKIFRSPQALQSFLKLANLMAEFGVRYEVVDAEGAVQHEPALRPTIHDISGGIFYPGDASGDARKFTQQLAEAAKKLGVEFEFGVTVEGAVKSGNKVQAVRTSVGEYAADAIVLAAGSYSDGVARIFCGRLPVRPVKGYSITLAQGGWNGAPKLPIVDDHYHAVATPLGDRLRVAGTAEFTGFDARLTQSRIDNLIKFVGALYPEFKPHIKDADINAWCGFRPMSSDGVPIMGKTNVENVFLNTGHGHLGWSMAAGSGRVVADLMSGKTPAIDPTPYSPRRFAS